ncbi:MAG: benzoate/H(+) symporter BenE family transporter [Luteimonas sp.]|nr:benzoate/H(+) symporter BenE family transporter [Luteimonas sp.]
MNTHHPAIRHGLWRDASFSAIVAGMVTVVVGFTSSAALVFEVARSLGATDQQIGSWIWALSFGIGTTCIVLSLQYRMPVVAAWSTPGAAMLITSVAGVPLSDAIGAFMVSALLFVLCGFSGLFERAVTRIPVSITSGMLGGVLLRFGLDAFSVLQVQSGMVLAMFATYLAACRLVPRYAVLLAMLAGIGVSAMLGLTRNEGFSLALATPTWVTPTFSIAAVLGIALPLFVVTMTSQNLAGAAVIRAAGYPLPLSPVIGWTGVANLLLAPFGAFALNLAAISAAISMGPEAHPDPAKRYVAAVATGAIYLVVGLFGATVASLFALLPTELVMAIAGFALLGTISNSLTLAMRDESEREAALVSFLLTASGVVILGIGSALWGLAAGLLVLATRRRGNAG